MPEWLGLERQSVLVASGGGTLGSALVGGHLSAGAAVGVLDLSGAAIAPLDPGVGSYMIADGGSSMLGP